MTIRIARRLAALALLSVFALLAAACGSTATTTTQAADVSDEPASESSDEGVSDSDPAEADHSGEDHADEDHAVEHDHDETIDVEAASAPTVTIEATADPRSGHNVRVSTTNFTVSALAASTEHVEGEGHMHLLIDGEKQGRFYNDWIHVDGLTPGEHTIEVELNANTHAPYAVDGERIAASQVVTVGEAAEHQHGEADVVDTNLGDGFAMEVTDDPRGGWNVNISAPQDFTISPQNASTDHVDGEGHLHLFVDGARQGRIYGEWVYVADQGAGEHTIEVRLSTNDHRDYANDGVPLSVETTVGEPTEDSAPEDSVPDDSVPEDSVMVMIDFADGEVTLASNGSDSDRIEAPLGSNVRLMITTDVTEHVHVHGYDIFLDLVPGETAVLDFVAEIPGLVEVELEDSHVFLFELSTQ